MAESQNQKPVIEIPPNAHPNADPNNYDPPTKRPVFPKGVFRKNNRLTVNSKDPGGFPNAKAASMLEKGWREMNIDEFDVNIEGTYSRRTDVLEKDIVVLISNDDGPEYEAKLISYKAGSKFAYRAKDIFTFQSLDSTKTWSYTRGELSHEKIRVYVKTDPVPFVHRPFVPRHRSRMQRQTRRQRKQRKQNGGFYPSVYGGIAGATMLTPLIARQMMRMYEQDGFPQERTRGETNTKKTRKTKSKKLSRNKRA